MTTVTEEEFIDIGSRMALELQDCIDDAEKAGCKDPFPGMKDLIDEWEAIYSRCNTWVNDLAGDGDIAALKLLNAEDKADQDYNARIEDSL